ncbi:nucleotide exchange factor GrpE [Nitrincola tapanii]|uniref:Protein GrpE n=1 Tax=Nitrincola tapanii TaxID=1708751 RepID=A0A5A9WAM1_9GAMM|nr:nucleotide exchange factor GrpE [Nitrincola tapanii]KAA0876481.1 nucleotide exchange factor GrpE [Nitrincola tapanii]
MANEQQKPVEPAAPQQAEQDIQATAAESVVESPEVTAQAEPETDALALAQAEIARLTTELAEQQLRTAAEIQNMRRRAEQDVEKAHKFALEKFAQELLPVLDSLERAIEACQSDDAAVKALREGVEMTLSIFLSSVAKFNLVVVNPLGEAFDPELHQAISMVPAPDAAPNSVVAVMQKGYSLNGRLVRPAMVMVAKA